MVLFLLQYGMRFSKKIKEKWADLLLGDFTAHDIALGIAIGTFIALLPTFGFSVFLALLFVFIFPHVNRPAIFLALLIWNPVVQVPVYALSLHLGSMLFEGQPLIQYDIAVLNQIYSFTRRFLVAHMIITTVFTMLMYVGSYVTFKYLIVRKIITLP